MYLISKRDFIRKKTKNTNNFFDKLLKTFYRLDKQFRLTSLAHLIKANLFEVLINKFSSIF